MFKSSILISGVTMVMLGAPVFAEDAAVVTNDNKPEMKKELRWDTNNDGFIGKDEWMKNQEDKFTKIDGDKDGKISPDEMKKYYGDMRDESIKRMKERREEMKTGNEPPVMLPDQTPTKP